MKVTMANAVLNVVLDYVLAGCLSMGAMGIAVASLISALVSLGWLWYYFERNDMMYLRG